MTNWRTTTRKYLYFYDANGNVGQVMDWSNGDLVAKYEYDPYGNTLVAAGDYASANPFRFSTKYWDDESGLGYWGYRYYAPRLGRWISRDPMGERSGSNLYAFCKNAAANSFDPEGRQGQPTSQPKTDPTVSHQDSNGKCCIYIWRPKEGLKGHASMVPFGTATYFLTSSSLASSLPSCLELLASLFRESLITSSNAATTSRTSSSSMTTDGPTSTSLRNSPSGSA